jgi:protein-tyrosine phosphatase
MEKPEDGGTVVGITQVWQRLFLGSLDDAERLGKANPLRINTVLSLSENLPCSMRREITYLHIPIEDEKKIPVGQFNAIIAAIAEHIRRGKVLVHCGGGVSRAPVMTAAYLQLVGYADFDTALAEIAELRPIVSPSAILAASVKVHLR